MTAIGRRITAGACTLLASAGLALGAASTADASPADPAPGNTASAAVTPQDSTPLVIQTRDYPVTMTISSGPKAGYKRVIGPRQHEVFPTTPNYSSSLTFTFNGVSQAQTYQVDPNRVMRFDMQGNAQFPAVTLRTS